MTWRPGQSGNPSGKPSYKPLTDAIRMELKADPKRARRIARMLLEKAEAGDLQAASVVMDRLEGKPAQSIDIKDDRALIDASERWARVSELMGKVIEGEAQEVAVPQLEDKG